MLVLRQGNQTVSVKSTSGLSLSCEVEEINVGFELQDGVDWKQWSLTGQIGSDGLARSK